MRKTQKRKPRGCIKITRPPCANPGHANYSSYSAIVNAYISNYSYDADVEMEWYSCAKNLNVAIERAALSQRQSLNRKITRHPHQQRLPSSALRKAAKTLCRARSDIQAVSKFSDLHLIVKDKIGSIRNIGELACYDIAHRIGAYLGIFPDAVYLHAGTRVGAKALGLRTNVEKIQAKRLPRAFRRLNAAQIEDCLCIYKKELAAIQKSVGFAKRSSLVK